MFGSMRAYILAIFAQIVYPNSPGVGGVLMPDGRPNVPVHPLQCVSEAPLS